MGDYIQGWIEVQGPDGAWKYRCDLMEWQNYTSFALLTGGEVRNEDDVPALLPKPRGRPDDADNQFHEVDVLVSFGGYECEVPNPYDCWSKSWVSLAELEAIDWGTPLVMHRGGPSTLQEVCIGLLREVEDMRGMGVDPTKVRMVFGFH